MTSAVVEHYDVIIVGGGHAGTEAALAAARIGARTLLLTHHIETLGQMSCNPAIGGIGKSHLVREVDALGGAMAQATDAAGIHFRVLNARKGPAVRATRAQADRALYRQAIRQILENQENLMIFQQAVTDVLIENQRCIGVETQLGLRFMAPSVVLTVGTFLAGTIHVGHQQAPGGRAGDVPAVALAENLRALDFKVGRLKTGTPPRIDKRSVDFSVLETQAGDEQLLQMSLKGCHIAHPPQMVCHIAHTNSQVHDVIRKNIEKSAMYSGNIEGVGPRYCPSIEDKIVRFADKDSHQIFIEPEGLTVNELYPNGLSTSLPFSVQLAMVRAMKGFENAHITRPGYAIEYDYFDPIGLHHTLETKACPGLFFAGQINGTTGYEEAAAQGLMAGSNAALVALGRDPWTLSRDQAYIGVLIDDLVTQGTQEPYRMFTSRAEYRLSLRQDNADRRLTAIGYKHGLVDEERWRFFCNKNNEIEALMQHLSQTSIKPDSQAGLALGQFFKKPLSRTYLATDLLKRPECAIGMLADLLSLEQPSYVLDQVDIDCRYAGYLARQEEEIRRAKHFANKKLPAPFDYCKIKGLPAEVIEKLNKIQPATLGQAGRISGVTPAAISLLLVYLKKFELMQAEGAC